MNKKELIAEFNHLSEAYKALEMEFCNYREKMSFEEEDIVKLKNGHYQQLLKDAEMKVKVQDENISLIKENKDMLHIIKNLSLKIIDFIDKPKK